MMTLSAKRMDYLAAGEYTDCRCVRIVRRDGVTIGVTTHYEAIFPDGPVVYQPAGGYESTSMASTASLSVDNLDISGVYDEAGINKQDLLGGLYDNAEMFVFDTDYLDPVEDEHPKRAGYGGKVRLLEHRFYLEFRSLTQMMQQPVGRAYTKQDPNNIQQGGVDTNPPFWTPSTDVEARPLADASQGSTVQPTIWNGLFARCTNPGTTGLTEPPWPTAGFINLSDGSATWWSIIAPIQKCVVTEIIDSRTFRYTGSVVEEPQWHQYGRVTWTAGNNQLLEMECIDNQWYGDPGLEEKEIVLFQPMTHLIVLGDTFDIEIGYDRLHTTLRDRFMNESNFAGFPFIPGKAAIGLTGGQTRTN